MLPNLLSTLTIVNVIYPSNLAPSDHAMAMIEVHGPPSQPEYLIAPHMPNPIDFTPMNMQNAQGCAEAISSETAAS